MSENETHQVDHSTCHAAACPMMATHNRSTNGEGEWLCFIHFGAEPGDRLKITQELNRLGWLVDLVRTLRAGRGVSAEQKRTIVLAQRSDLAHKESECRSTWMIRLEGVLQQSCRDSVVEP